MTPAGGRVVVMTWSCLPPEDLEALDRAYIRLARRLRRKRAPGRPRSPAVTAAVEMRRQGKLWHQIYPKAICGYWSLDEHERYHARENLRKVVKAALRRERQARQEQR
jgi:hypothetical protein